MLQNFIAILKGFETLITIPSRFAEASSSLLKKLTQYEEKDGAYPNLKEQLEFFKVRKGGTIYSKFNNNECTFDRKLKLGNFNYSRTK